MRIQTLLHTTLTLIAVAAIGCGGRLAYNTPPAQQLMHPGPGVGGPGPGVIPVGGQMMMGAPTGPPRQIGPGGTSACQQCNVGGCESGACLASDASFATDGGGDIQLVQYCVGGYCGPGGGGAGYPPTSQIAFVGEEGLQVAWSVSSGAVFDSAPLVVPGRQDFPQGAIYRLKLTGIPGRLGISLYPTLEVAPVTPRTDAYLAHAPIPVQFTEEDFDQVLTGNFVTKVIYLPDPEFQELALAGVETLVSTRLDPGCDPVAEADRRGSILAIVRIGNKDLEGLSNYSDGSVIPAQFEGEQGYAEPPPMPGDYSVQGPYHEGPYNEGEYYEGEVYGGEHYEGEVYGGCEDGSCYGGPGMVPGGMAGSPVPVGAPTAGFAPAAMPPHFVGGAPQYGLPITGTPIGLPGPPHLPLGSPAGLQRHVMKNRTRIHMPPPTPQVTVSVKQRPGLNYPTPVSKIHIDETKRAPARLFHGTLKGPLHHLLGRLYGAHASDGECEQCQ